MGESESRNNGNRNKLVAESEVTVEHRKENKQASSRMSLKRRLPYVVGFSFLIVGLVALVLSIAYSSVVLAFIGLGLTLWGGLFLFVKPAKYTKASLLGSTVRPSLIALDKILSGLSYEGQGVHLPPSRFEGLKRGVVFVPKRKETILLPAEGVAEETAFVENPEGICLPALGQDLLVLYEKELKKDLSGADLSYIKSHLPKLFTENLEMLEDLEIDENEGNVKLKMFGSIYNDLCNYLSNHTSVCARFGCPFSSSVACALAKATGKAVIIEKCKVVNEGKIVEIWYNLKSV
jgi:hypothetical protein